MRGIKHFIWDFDGTLFDTYPMISSSFQSALRDCGVEADRDEIYRLMMKSIPETFEYYSKKYKLGEDLSAHYKRYMQNESSETSFPFPYVTNICELISKSGKFNYLFTHRGNSANQFLQDNNMQFFFVETVTAENGFKRKPDPEAIYYLLNRYNMKKEETLMVGDRKVDIQSGENAGISTCYITNGFALGDVSSDYCFNNIRDMYKQVAQL